MGGFLMCSDVGQRSSRERMSGDCGDLAVYVATFPTGSVGSPVDRQLAGRACPAARQRSAVGTDPYGIDGLTRDPYDGVESPKEERIPSMQREKAVLAPLVDPHVDTKRLAQDDAAG